MRLHAMQRTVLLSQFCLSVRLSVTCVDYDKTKWCTTDILIHTKGQSLCYSDTTVVGGRRLLLSEVCTQSDPPPSKRRLKSATKFLCVKTFSDNCRAVNQVW